MNKLLDYISEAALRENDYACYAAWTNIINIPEHHHEDVLIQLIKYYRIKTQKLEDLMINHQMVCPSIPSVCCLHEDDHE